ncbi:MAG TPA: DNA polymerase III subunit beta [Parachlamydiales bacterium]|nr:DNA polymerase III subunit beta [Parachlamydiales bacterium]
MKLILPRVELCELINKIQGVVPPKPAIPLLANVLLEAQDDQLILSVTDLIVSMRVFTSAQVMEEGALALPARRFFQLVKELTAPQVEIHALTGEIAYLNAGSSHFKIQGMNKEEFPALPALEEGVRLPLSQRQLKELLSRTLFAAAREDPRPVLNGILMELKNHLATFIGTDGKRLAKLKTTLETPLTGEGSYVLPIKAVEEMLKILSDKEECAEVLFLPDKMGLKLDHVTLIAKLILGQYPNVERIIPKKTQNPLLLHREELMALLRQISLFTTEMSSSARFTFTTGELHLSAASSELGEGKVSMPVNYTGPKKEIAFNPHYFLDILRHSRDESVHFDLLDAYNPGLITDSTAAEFVIMPMRLEDHGV